MNPLLTLDFPIPFADVRPEHVEPAVDALVDDAHERVRRIIELEEARTFENTMLALDAITERIDRAMRVLGHLDAVASDDSFRAAHNRARVKVKEFTSGIPLSSALWQAVTHYAASEESRTLEGPRKRFLDKTVSYFTRHGAGLNEADKKRLREIEVSLTRDTLRYTQNVRDSTNAFELLVVDESQLTGLPARARQAARESARSKGKEGWRFTLQAPSYVPLLRSLDDRTVRERVYRALATIATQGDFDNRPIVRRILELRREKARLLGYDHFADFVLEERMAKNGEAAQQFVRDLRARTAPAFARETGELAALQKELECVDAGLEGWDVSYYAEKLRQRLYRFDEEALRPYFSFDSVIDGLFEVAGRLFGVRFETYTDAQTWDPHVKAFLIRDDAGEGAGGEEPLAAIYIDAFARDNKRAGAWMDGILSRVTGDDDTRQVGVLVANLTPPIADGKALLTHREVATLFHEFGHLLHHCLSRVAIRSQAGTRVAWDFVELPSQLLENWCWEREGLDLFARHSETGLPIPDDLFTAMQRARQFRAASEQMRQLGFAAADLTLHIDAVPDDPTAVVRSIVQEHSPTPLPPEHAAAASFEHLFGYPVGYAAGFYSYKWAEVLDADAFTRFKHEGLLDQQVGMAFRKCVLERGDEDDPGQLFRDFMGRNPTLQPLLDRLGLASGGS